VSEYEIGKYVGTRIWEEAVFIRPRYGRVPKKAIFVRDWTWFILPSTHMHVCVVKHAAIEITPHLGGLDWSTQLMRHFRIDDDR
jgi:hypothetical protein